MQTTEERATARFRFAGGEQLASHTARPLALSDSLSSMQLHESAMNNFLSCMELSGRKWTLPELFGHLQRKLGSEQPAQLDDLPENVTIRFADEDPIFTQCAEGQLRVVVSIAELQQADRSWENVEFHVNYRLVAEGFQLKLVRDGAVSLRGDHTGRVDVVLRTIGSKLFPRDQAVSLIPEAAVKDERFQGLAWSQVQVENGWLGLSLSDEMTVMARQRIETTTR